MALVTVDDVLSYLGHDAEQDAFWIHCSDATATTATAHVSLGFLILQRDGVNVAGTPLNLTTLTTITLLVQAINAIPNWEAGVICHPSSVSLDLLETGQLNCLLVVNEVTFRITGDYLITQLIARAGDFLDRICGRNLESAEYTHERYDGGERKIFLKNWPVSEVTQISSGKMNAIRIRYTSTTAYNAYAIVSTTGVTLVVDGTVAGAEITFAAPATLLTVATAINALAGWTATVAATAYNGYPATQIFRKLNRFALNQYAYLQIPDEPLDGYEIDYDNGILDFSPIFSSGWRNVFVTYTGGYETVPSALQQICIELVKYKYNNRKQDSGMKSEQIGKVYQYTRQDLKDALPPDMMAELELFKSRDS